MIMNSDGVEKKSQSAIYIPYHDNFDVVRAKNIHCLYIGDEKRFLNKNLKKIDGVKNVLSRNPPLNEMVAFYHAWKHDKDSDYIGIFHYRRHLILSRRAGELQEDVHGLVNVDRITDEYVHQIGLSEQNIADLMADYDVVLPKPWSAANAGSIDLYDHFAKHSPVGIAHLDLTLKLIDEYDPAMGKYAREYVRQPVGYFTNMLVAKRSIFMDYCEWFFKLSPHLEDAINPDELNQVQYRMYVSEWMFSIYFNYMKNKHNWRVYEAPRTMVHNPKMSIEPLVDTKGKLQPVAISTVSSDNYSQHTASLIVSIMDNINRKKFVDFIIVGDGWTDTSKRKFKMLEKQYADRLSIRFHQMDGYEDLHVHSHFTKHTFFRFAFPKIFSKYEKLIYLDSDITVTNDIDDLYSLDMKGLPLAAVPCTAMKMMAAEKIGCLAECGNFNAGDYVRHFLNVRLDEGHIYFNAGVLLMNIPVISKGWDDAVNGMIKSRNGVFWFVDQDILNAIFAGRVLPLDEKWNVQNIPMDRLAKAVPVTTYLNHKKVREAPAIVHYAGGERKPWNDTSMDMAEYYWQYVQTTPWFPEAVMMAAGATAVVMPPVPAPVFREPPVQMLQAAPQVPPSLVVRNRTLVLHSRKAGLRERLNGTAPYLQDIALVEASGMFDPEWYRTKYNVKVRKGREIFHFVTTGWKLGYSPSRDFDLNYYLTNNSDVAESNMNPLIHYVVHGESEGRKKKSLEE